MRLGVKVMKKKMQTHILMLSTSESLLRLQSLHNFLFNHIEFFRRYFFSNFFHFLGILFYIKQAELFALLAKAEYWVLFCFYYFMNLV